MTVEWSLRRLLNALVPRLRNGCVPYDICGFGDQTAIVRPRRSIHLGLKLERVVVTAL